MITSVTASTPSRRNHTSSVLWLSVLGIVVLMTACGGAGSESGSTIESPDGLATLVIPEGSLPEGVSIDDVRIDRTDVLSEEPGAPVLAVILTPSGLNLSAAATLRVEIPDALEQILVVHSSADGFEFLDATLEPSDDKLAAAIELSDFSFINIYEADFFTVTAAATPETVSAGETQSVTLEMTISDPLIPIWVQLGDRDTPTYQLFEFGVEGINGTYLYQPTVDWTDPGAMGVFVPSDGWAPNDVEAQLVEGELSLAMFASSRCKSPTDAVARIGTSIALKLRLAAKSVVLDGVTLGMKDLLDSSDSDVIISKLPRIGRDSYDVPIGRTVSAFTYVGRALPAECLEVVGASTSSSTTQPPNDTEESSEIHLVDPAGDAECEDAGDTLDPALDVTALDIVQDGDGMEATITYDGDAEAFNKASADKFPFALQFRLKEQMGGPFPEVFFIEKDKLKVSGGLLQVISYEFSGNKLVIRLAGRTLEDVHAAQTSTSAFDRGRCRDLAFSEGYND
ncbi:MAG: hypothetical protein GY720_23260 [bacterium]|nr:hypothetical protein [bacterium]